jgi:hypothetical protein
MFLSFIKNFVFLIYWPALIIGTIYLLVRGGYVYRMVKGSLIGKITRVFIYTMFIGMYSLGVISVVFLYYQPSAAYLIFPIFVIWLAMFLWSFKVLVEAEKKARNISGQQK